MKEITDIRGIGYKKAEKLAEAGIKNIEELLKFFPRKYDDRRKIKKISESSENEKITLFVSAFEKTRTSYYSGNRSYSILKCFDDTGSIILKWFNMPYADRIIGNSNKFYVYGKITLNNNTRIIVNPEIITDLDSYKIGSILPVYKKIKGINNNEIIRIMREVFEKYSELNKNVIPEEIIAKYKLYERNTAFQKVHFPDNISNYKKAKITLIFEEMLSYFIVFKILRKKLVKYKGIEFKKKITLNEFEESLEFKLTDSQKKSIRDIESDMCSSKTMNRMIQGDVGCGKTIVAVYASILSALNGFQTIVMVPTEILAVQHFDTFRSLCEKYGLEVSLLKGKMNAAEKKDIRKKIIEGKTDIIIGTHALIQEDVEFSGAGLVITDEQHRFGVRQRSVAVKKGTNPDVLVMSATPIPRTMAMFLFGDLDVSYITEMPAGRKETKTRVIKSKGYTEVLDFASDRIEEGRQVYIVVPYIEDKEDDDISSVENTYNKIKKNMDKYSISKLHSKMTAEEKNRIFKDFKSGKTQILISTTVIEVGIDVANANIMIIENAERFGLAQLHQLRGRIGRGSHESFCFLISDYSDNSRLEIMEKYSDGLEIAAEDLKIRGPGEFFGTRQHGISEIDSRIYYNYPKLIECARHEAENILRNDPELKENSYLKNKIFQMIEEKKTILN